MSMKWRAISARPWTKAMGLGAGADRSWSNLGAFVWICALIKAVPLVMLPLIGWAQREELGAGAGAEGGGGGSGGAWARVGAGGEAGAGGEGDSALLTGVGSGDDATDATDATDHEGVNLLSASSDSGGGGGGRKYLLSDDVWAVAAQ
jgi:hypothetical protein